ncbi:hypothetical protein EK904_000637 [Melospiza melodia maxima]|nr:hypothetical protein EK904_000637 [Melospiza melodia maxima]
MNLGFPVRDGTGEGMNQLEMRTGRSPNFSVCTSLSEAGISVWKVAQARDDSCSAAARFFTFGEGTFTTWPCHEVSEGAVEDDIRSDPKQHHGHV